MSIVNVEVRHNGQKHAVEVDLNEPGEVFKMQLYSMTGVPPDRQKILVKGGQLKNDTDMKTLNLKPNQSLMMLGSAEELPKAPESKAQFLEDMDDRQLAEKQVIPTGLVNTGNTCYLNSTLQAMRTVPELMTNLEAYKGSPGMAPDLARDMRELYRGMKSTNDAFTPTMFTLSLRNAFPQFAERGDHGEFKQQDAEEAWSQIMAALRANLKDTEGRDVIDSYFGGQCKSTLTCDETDDEPAREEYEDFFKLDCHISGQTNFVRDGLLAGLKEKIEKHNDSLGRNAQYTRTKSLTRLPKYLTVHYVRFFWKRDVGKKAKILRKVSFPFNYDATELCTEELQQRLIPAREKYREVEKEKEELRRVAKRSKTQGLDEELARKVDKEGQITDEKREELQKELDEALDPELKKDATTNATGLYQLSAVITHQGAFADAGHYQCFARNEKEPGKWWKFNDDKVSIVDESKVEGLDGGGQSDSALILLYKAVSL